MVRRPQNLRRLISMRNHGPWNLRHPMKSLMTLSQLTMISVTSKATISLVLFGTNLNVGLVTLWVIFRVLRRDWSSNMRISIKRFLLYPHSSPWSATIWMKAATEVGAFSTATSQRKDTWLLSNVPPIKEEPRETLARTTVNALVLPPSRAAIMLVATTSTQTTN